MKEDKSRLMGVKRKLDKKKPNFIREGSQHSVRIGKKWRRPRGLQSKMRHQFAGHRIKVKAGFMSPAKVRDLDKEGYKLINVAQLKDLEVLDPKFHKIIINSNIGLRKKILLFEKIAEKGFKVYLCKDPSKKIEELKEKIRSKKAEKEKKEKVKKEKKEKVTKKKPELEEKVLTAEDKKKEEKKEMEKVITKSK